MKELQKYGIVTEMMIPVSKFYDIISSYQGKEGHEFETYACTSLSENYMISFISPNQLTLLEIYFDHGIPRYANTILTFDDTFKILNPYLRKYKIKKLKGM